MSRLTIGAALGGAAVYFFDPQQGENRRRQVQALWRENRGPALAVGGGASQAAESMRPLVRRVKRGIERGDWAEDGGRNWMPGLTTGVVIAAALGGALVYFLDPQNGLVRRQRVLSFMGERQGAVKARLGSAQKAASTVKPRAKQAVDEASEAVVDVGAKGRG